MRSPKDGLPHLVKSVGDGRRPQTRRKRRVKLKGLPALLRRADLDAKLLATVGRMVE